jgi:hypothetical protein
LSSQKHYPFHLNNQLKTDYQSTSITKKLEKDKNPLYIEEEDLEEKDLKEDLEEKDLEEDIQIDKILYNINKLV